MRPNRLSRQSYALFGVLFWATALFADVVGDGGLAREKILLARQDPNIPTLYGRRFMEPADWDMALKGFRPEWDTYPRKYIPNEFVRPEYAYGIESYQAFVKGIQFAHQSAPSRPPTIADYRELHRRAYGFHNAFAFSYWTIAEKIDDPTRREMAKRLIQAGAIDEAIRLGLLPQLLGMLRSDRGSPGFVAYGIDGHRYLVSRAELRVLQSRPLLTVKVIDTLPSGEIVVTIDYPPSKDVEKLLTDQLRVMEKDVRLLLKQGLAVTSASYREQAAEIAGELYQSILEIHPFSDGNGRTAKLMRDWLLWHLGLNAASATPAADLAMTRISYATELKKNVEATRKELFRLVPASACGGSLAAE